jgi:two-component system sensor histidine kinase/response regulator
LGIPPEFSDSLLNESSFHTSFGTNKEHGSGIGLKICKKFIEQQGGKISFHSSVGQGSTFTFSIPIPERTNPTEVRRP